VLRPHGRSNGHFSLRHSTGCPQGGWRASSFLCCQVFCQRHSVLGRVTPVEAPFYFCAQHNVGHNTSWCIQIDGVTWAPLVAQSSRSQQRTQIRDRTPAPGPRWDPGAAARSSGRARSSDSRGFQESLVINSRKLLTLCTALVKQGVRPPSIVPTSVVPTVYWCDLRF
jgi:hypothetical protein